MSGSYERLTIIMIIIMPCATALELHLSGQVDHSIVNGGFGETIACIKALDCGRGHGLKQI